MPFTSADLAALDASIASGVQEITFSDGRRVRYATLDEKLRARAVIVAELSANASNDRTVWAMFTRD